MDNNRTKNVLIFVNTFYNKSNTCAWSALCSRSAKSFKVMTAATPSLPGYLFSMFLNHFVYTIYWHYIFLCSICSSVLTPYSYKLQLDWKQNKCIFVILLLSSVNCSFAIQRNGVVCVLIISMSLHTEFDRLWKTILWVMKCTPTNQGVMCFIK